MSQIFLKVLLMTSTSLLPSLPPSVAFCSVWLVTVTSVYYCHKSLLCIDCCFYTDQHFDQSITGKNGFPTELKQENKRKHLFLATILLVDIICVCVLVCGPSYKQGTF